MGTFSLKDSDEYYLELTENPKRFEADSPVTNVFFDDTNGQVFTVRSGGVTGVSVSGMNDSKSTSFRMEDKGPITSIKFSLNHKILAIQRNRENQASSVEFLNFQDLAPTNVEYTHTCKWKTAKILGFVWPKDNEIAFVTDHGIELLQVVAEKKVLKSVKNTSFSGAWFTWCAQSKILLLASNNGTLLQPFSLANSAITKLHKLELESGRPVAERDVVAIRVYGTTWCAVFRHANAAQSSAGPTEVCLMPVWGPAHTTHVLKTGLVGRFAVSVVDDVVIVHHQSSQTSLLFDIEEECKSENNQATHIPLLPGLTIKPAFVDEQLCPMYSGNWVVFQPDYLVDARLGCLWQLKLSLTGFLHCVAKEEIAKLISALLRRSGSKDLVLLALRQLVEECGTFLAQLADVFDAVHQAHREWVDCETQRQTCGSAPTPVYRVVLSQNDICQHVLAPCSEHPYIVQALTCYMSSLCRCDVPTTAAVAELAASLIRPQRVANIVRRGCLTDGKPIACQLLSLGHLEPAAAQLALDMMYRLKAHEEIVEVLLSYEEPIAAAAAARHGGVWNSLPARKLLAAATKPQAFVSLYHALRARDSAEPLAHRIALNPNDNFAAHYKKLTSD